MKLTVLKSRVDSPSICSALGLEISKWLLHDSPWFNSRASAKPDSWVYDSIGSDDNFGLDVDVPSDPGSIDTFAVNEVLGALGGQYGDVWSNPRSSTDVDFASVIDVGASSNVDAVHHFEVVAVRACERCLNANAMAQCAFLSGRCIELVGRVAGWIEYLPQHCPGFLRVHAAVNRTSRVVPGQCSLASLTVVLQSGVEVIVARVAKHARPFDLFIRERLGTRFVVIIAC